MTGYWSKSRPIVAKRCPNVAKVAQVLQKVAQLLQCDGYLGRSSLIINLAKSIVPITLTLPNLAKTKAIIYSQK